MSKQKQSSSTNVDPKTDPINPLLALTLAKRALEPPINEIDLDEFEEDLTDDELDALDTLGTSEEIVQRVLDQLDVESELEDLDTGSMIETGMGSLASTQAESGRRFYVQEQGVGRDDLLERMESFEREQHVSLPTTYRKKKELGRGGQGVVYLAECLDEFRGEHALKIFSPHPYPNASAYEEDMKRMKHVATLIHRKHMHNLVDIERFPDRRGIYAMVMQWIDGYDLKKLMAPKMVQCLKEFVPSARWAELNDSVFKKPVEKQHRLQPGFAVYVIEESLRGLGALHGHGIIHGDIKPANIMLDCHGRIMLIDVGSASEISTPPRHRNWTPLYAPPEYLEYGIWNEKSDLACLGYVLIELLSGRRSVIGPGGDQSTITSAEEHKGTLLDAKTELPDRLTEILPTRARESEQLVNLCRRLIDPDPERRFSDASEAIEGSDGTFNFNKQLVLGDMSVHYASHIQRWLNELKQADEQDA